MKSIAKIDRNLLRDDDLLIIFAFLFCMLWRSSTSIFIVSLCAADIGNSSVADQDQGYIRLQFMHAAACYGLRLQRDRRAYVERHSNLAVLAANAQHTFVDE